MAEQHPIAAGMHALQEFMEREKSRGVSHVAISPESTELLQAMPLDIMRTMQERRSAQSPEETRSAPAVVSETESQESISDPSSGSERRTEEWAREQLNRIYREVKTCQVCRSLGTLRDTVVFACGNPLADLMFVGEAPGAEEEKERKPFVGPAGQKLTQIIMAMGLSRDDVYISNIVKYRPKKDDGRFQGSSNRKPNQTEMESSIRYIREEIAVVSPKVIVALGATAAEGLLERGGSVAGMRNQDVEFAGVPVIVTYHPSYLLRQESEPDQAKAKAAKRLVWEDMLRAMDTLGMPVTEKQRGFFL